MPSFRCAPFRNMAEHVPPAPQACGRPVQRTSAGYMITGNAVRGGMAGGVASGVAGRGHSSRRGGGHGQDRQRRRAGPSGGT
ncbi:MAG: hypothetical protein IRY95_07155 [Clostridia bacterium]|nr:hypothetical protein [Clostridia bacterium]